MSEHIDRIRAFAHWIAQGKGHATQEAVDAMALLADYDALAARLAEAEALLRELLTTADCDRPPLEDRIDAFLGATMGNSRRHKAGWIPCDIRLPERDGYYLTYDASTPGAGDEYLVAEFDVRRGCFEDESIGFIPTHWMDLPEPPARGMRAPIEEAGRE